MLHVHSLEAVANTLGLPCRAEHVVSINDVTQLPELSRLWQQSSLTPWVLGSGSNVILPPRLDRLLVLPRLRGIKLLHTTADAWIVQAMAGESWHDVVQYTLAQGWPGLENLALIPGTVGATPVQNIGAYGVELHTRLHSVLAWHINERKMYELSAQACQFAYRDSRFKHESGWVIAAVRLRLPRPWQAVLHYPALQQHLPVAMAIDAHAVFDAVCAIRRSKLPDPAVLGNAGSYFQNPVVEAAHAARLQAVYPHMPVYPHGNNHVKLAAGWLIEQAGWKGRRLGSVGMHADQALVLVNHGQARLEDVMALEDAVRHAVHQQFGVHLHREPVLFPSA